MSETKTWQQHIRENHPASDPQYWPDELIAKYARAEVDNLRKENAALRDELNEAIEKLELARMKTYAAQISDIAKERDAALVDAQKWQDYQSRKDAVIAAGMGKKAMRATVAGVSSIP